MEHPIRTEILSILRDGPSSPTRIARRLPDVSLNLISHHIKVLKELSCIELTETVNKRGATEHIYRAVRGAVVSDEEWASLTPKMRQPITAGILRLISDDLAKSLGEGKFEEMPDTHLSRTPLSLDDAGWGEARDVLARALEEVIEVGRKSSKRIAESEEPAMPVSVVIMQFLTAE